MNNAQNVSELIAAIKTLIAELKKTNDDFGLSEYGNDLLAWLRDLEKKHSVFDFVQNKK